MAGEQGASSFDRGRRWPRSPSLLRLGPGAQMRPALPEVRNDRRLLRKASGPTIVLGEWAGLWRSRSSPDTDPDPGRAGCRQEPDHSVRASAGRGAASAMAQRARPRSLEQRGQVRNRIGPADPAAEASCSRSFGCTGAGDAQEPSSKSGPGPASCARATG